jgi:hypothetical protein
MFELTLNLTNSSGIKELEIFQEESELEYQEKELNNKEKELNGIHLSNISILKILQENLHKKPNYPHDDDCYI